MEAFRIEQSVKIESMQGSLYDSSTDSWSPFRLPESYSLGFEGLSLSLLNWRIPRSFLCGASRELLYILSDLGSYVRSFMADNVERPWQTIAFIDKNEKLKVFKALSLALPATISGFDELSLLAYSSTDRDSSALRARIVSTFRFAPDLQTPVNNDPSHTSEPFSLVEDIARKQPPHSDDGSCLSRLHYVRGEPLILDKLAGRWHRTAKPIEYRDAFDAGSSPYLDLLVCLAPGTRPN